MTVKIPKGKRVYYTDFRIYGNRIRKKVPGGTTNKRVAQDYENDLKLKMLKGEIGICHKDPKLEDIVQEYLSFYKTNREPSSYERAEGALRNFLRITGFNKLSQITPRSIERYKELRRSGPNSVAAGTVNLEVRMLKAMLNHMVKSGEIPANPIRFVEKIRGEDSEHPQYLEVHEIEALLNTASPTFYPIFYTLLKTGLRKAELVHLEWSDVDFKNKLITVANKKSHHTKSHKSRTVPMDQNLEKVLQSIKRTKDPHIFITGKGTLRTNNLITVLKRTAKKAGIKKNVTIHMLRHTYASYLAMKGCPLATLRDLLGHKSIETTTIYTHSSEDHLQEEVGKLPY